MDDLQKRKNEAILACCSRILEGARTAGAQVRAVGGVAVYLKCKGFQSFIRSCRDPFSDIDLATTSEDLGTLVELFEEWGFEQNQEVKILFGRDRRVFYTEQNISIDVYIDKLALCQEVPLRERLSLDYPTLSCTELFLSKIQNVSWKAKDLFDMRVLLRHVAQHATADSLDLDYISWLSRRWNWWRTLKLNLPKLREHDTADGEGVHDLLYAIEDAADGCRKTLRWRLRNLIGDRIRWYSVVDE